MNNNRNDEPALLGVFSKSNYITFGTKEDPFPFKDSKALQRDALKGKQMMTRPALQGRTTDTYFGKKHLYVAEGCPFVDRLKYQETQKVKPKKGFHTSDYSRRDEFSMTFRTDQHRELLKLEAKHAKRALQQMAAASQDGTLAAMEASLPKSKPQPEVFLYDLVFDMDSGSGRASKLARDTKNPTALSHERDNGHYVTTTSHAHPAFKSSTPFTKPEHVHKPIIHDTFYRKTNVFFREGGTAVAAT